VWTGRAAAPNLASPGATRAYPLEPLHLLVIVALASLEPKKTVYSQNRAGCRRARPGVRLAPHSTIMFRNFYQILRSYEPWEILLEMAVIWLCVYVVFRFLRGTRGAWAIKGVAVLIVVLTLLLRVIGQGTDTFGRLDFIYGRFVELLALLLIVVFQPELRQAMIRLGRARLFRPSRSEIDEVIDAVNSAVGLLSKNQFGALIAIERSVKLGGLTEGGVTIDAKVNSRLLQSIFWPNNPLHDLGVVIRGDRVVAACVQFPLAEGGHLPEHLGSRHRAGLGLTLEADCVVVIVSEETGTISIAEHGHLQIGVSREDLADELRRRLKRVPPSTEPLEPEPSKVDRLESIDDAAAAPTGPSAKSMTEGAS